MPFKPNVSKLSERIGVNRNTLVGFLKHLEDMRIIKRLYSSVHGIGLLQKPEKLYLHHPNHHFALASENSNIGNIRESFFANQAGAVAKVTYASEGDFVIGDHVFEVGGRDKTSRQVKHLPDSYIVADDIEIGHQRKIPLWLFGFLY